MLKPASLRAAITAAVPHLQKNPQDLHVFIESGSLRSTMAGGLSCEYSYTLSITLTDYAGHADLVFIPILAWLRYQQPEMLLNPELMKDGFSFEVDFLAHDKCDIQIKLQLTERVRVTQALATEPPGDQDGLRVPVPDGLRGLGTIATITHLEEPQVDPYQFIERWQLYISGEKVQEWDTRPFEGTVTP